MMLHERLKAIMTSRLDCTARMVLVVIADAMATDDPSRPALSIRRGIVVEP